MKTYTDDKTRTIETIGMITTKDAMKFKQLTVRYTSDEIGKTLSLSVEEGENPIMLTVSFDFIERMIKNN